METNDQESEGIQLLKALGHPQRRAILKDMADAQAISPVELSSRLRLSLNQVSYHVRVLAKCEAIVLVDTQPARGSLQHFYRFNVKAQWAHEILGLFPPPQSME
jgi:DNA-binding transcriptional ArsR family regulator